MKFFESGRLPPWAKPHEASEDPWIALRPRAWAGQTWADELQPSTEEKRFEAPNSFWSEAEALRAPGTASQSIMPRQRKVKKTKKLRKAISQ